MKWVFPISVIELSADVLGGALVVLTTSLAVQQSDGINYVQHASNNYGYLLDLAKLNFLSSFLAINCP